MPFVGCSVGGGEEGLLEGNRGKALGMLPSSELTLGHWDGSTHACTYGDMLHAQSAKGVCVCVCVCEWATVQVCEAACTHVLADTCTHEVCVPAEEHTLESTCANVHTCTEVCRCEHANVGANVHTQGAVQVCAHANVHAQVPGLPMEVCIQTFMYARKLAGVCAKAHKCRKRARVCAGLPVTLYTRMHARVNTHSGARSCAHAHSAQTPLLWTSKHEGALCSLCLPRERKCRPALWVAPPTPAAASAAFTTAVTVAAASADPPPPPPP